MSASSPEEHLRRFQDQGDRDGLVQYLRASGSDTASYRQVIDGLEPVFEALSFGEQPSYESLDKESLRGHAAEVEEVVELMFASVKADMRAAAAGLMGYMGWDSFVAPLERLLVSDVQWERLTAVRALAQMRNEKALTALKAAAASDDPEVRAEALRIVSEPPE